MTFGLLELLVGSAFVEGCAVEMSERSEFSKFVSNGDAKVQLDVRDAASDDGAQCSVEMVDGGHLVERSASKK